MYSRILVPLDGSDLSEQALPYAITLSQTLDCPIELLRVVENQPLYTGGEFEAVPTAYEAMSTEEREAECQEYLDKVAGRLREKGLEVSTAVRAGMAAKNIVAEAAGSENTILTMASHGRSGIYRWILGSVADGVLRQCVSPLLLIRPRDGDEAPMGAPVSRIIAPVDGSTLAERALAHVARLAKAFEARVDLVRVTPSASEYYRQASLHPAGGVPATYYPPYEEISESMDSEAQAYLEKTKAALEAQGVSLVEMHLVHGHPAVVISDMARADSGSMVVMATHGRSGIERWVLGSVADSVARHSGSPVFLARVA